MKKTNDSKPSASKTKIQDAKLVHKCVKSSTCAKMPVANVPPPPSAKSKKSSTSK